MRPSVSQSVLSASLALLSFAPLPAQTAGTLDPTFHGTGIVLPAMSGRFRGVAVQPDGRIVAAGTEFVAAGTWRWTVQRFLDDGSADASFGSAGVVSLFGASNADEANQLVLDGAGRILVVGTSVHLSHMDVTVVRLNPDGTLDGTFGAGGVTRVHGGFKNTGSSWGRALALDGSGRIVVAGLTSGKRDLDMVLARLTANGALETSFGGGAGKLIDDLGTSYDAPWYGSLAVQPDGRIFVGGFAGSGSSATGGWYVMRYLSSGALDPSWGSGGRVNQAFPGMSYPRLMGLQLLADGSVLTSGRIRNDVGGSYFDCLVARYTAAGTLDPTFHGTGYATSGVAGDDQGYTNLVVQPDGKPVVGTGKDGVITCVRMQADGSLDAGFGTGGLATGAGGGFPWGVCRDGAGRILVAGELGGPALVRYLGN